MKNDGTMEPPALLWKEPGVVVTEMDHSAQCALIFQENVNVEGYIPRSGTPPPPPSAREQKRPKKQRSPRKDKSVTAEAASGSEDRQS